MRQKTYFDDAPDLPPVTGRRVHDFRERLAASEGAHMDPFWEATYRIAFPSIVACVSLQGDTTSQRQGKDRLLHLANGQTLYVQEKVRETWRDDSDILIEYEHQFTNGTIKPGWIAVDQDIHYLAYAFKVLRRVYIFPWHQLRRAWAVHGAFWRSTYRPVVAVNRTWNTHSCPVPTRDLRGAVAQAARIDLPSEV